MEIKKSGVTQQGMVVNKPWVKAENNTSQLNPQDSLVNSTPLPELPAVHKKWTILSYIAGDNNLEPHMVRTVDSMEMAGSDENTHMVAQLDRGPNPSDRVDPGWKNCRRFYVMHDEVKDKLNSQVLAQYDRTNMADPNVLKDFLVWGMKTYPSDYLAVFLNDHGDGFRGAMHDTSDAPSTKRFMTLPDIQWAVEEAEKESNRKVNLLGFNACLMANIEAAYQLKDTADYMVASEEVEISPGWTVDNQYPRGRKEMSEVLAESFVSFEKNLKNRITMNPQELAELIVNTNASHTSYIPTLSAIDLKEVKAVADSLGELGEKIKNTPNKEEVEKAFNSAENYSITNWPRFPYNYVRDLQQSCQNLIKLTPDEEVKKAAQKVIETAKKAIIANQVNEGKKGFNIPHPNSTGLTVFAPLKASGFENEYNILALEKDTNWLKSTSTIGDNGPDALTNKLHLAVRGNNLKSVEELLTAGADVNGKDGDGVIPLMYATYYSQKQIIELMLAKGADFNFTEPFKGASILHRLTARGYADIVGQITEKGADVNSTDNSGNTPLHSGIQSKGVKDTKVLEVLIERGADINAKDTAGKTSLMMAAQRPEVENCGPKVVMDFLLKKDAHVNDQDNEGLTALHYTVVSASSQQTHVDLAKLLLSYKADPNIKDVDEHTPLYYAVRFGKKELADFLRQNGGIEE